MMDNERTINHGIEGVCLAHPGMTKTLERIEDKMDELIVQQTTIVNRQLEHIERIVRVEAVVTNGLSHNVQHIVNEMASLCNRINKIDEFKWFREWMTKLRDDLFANILRVVFIVGGIAVIIYFAEGIIRKILK